MHWLDLHIILKKVMLKISMIVIKAKTDLNAFFFLVLYSRVVMETGQRAKLLVYSLYASSTVLAFGCLNAKQVGFHIFILFKWRLFLHIFKC